MESKMYEEALKEYEKSLERSKNRFNSLYGAGKASELSGDMVTAMKYYEKLVDQTKNADPGLKPVIYAREFVNSNK